MCCSLGAGVAGYFTIKMRRPFTKVQVCFMRASEQDKVIGFFLKMGSNLPQVVATDFFFNSPVLAETPVTQHSPCYSAVSATFTNPLPDCSTYSLFCHTHYLIFWMTLYQNES